QTYAGITVFGGEVTVQLDGSDGVVCVLSDIERNLKKLDDGTISIVPRISAADAPARVRQLYATSAPGLKLQTSSPQLMIFAPSVIGASGEIRLVWEMTVTSDDTSYVNEQVLLDAQTGEIVRQYPLNLTFLKREIYDAAGTTSDPGTKIRSEGDGASGIADVDNAYDFLGDTYNFYWTHHMRDGIDPTGLYVPTLKATVRYCKPDKPCPWTDARWDGSQMYFGAGLTVDDVTGHELTHGVTQLESGLKYENASGAINE